MKGEVMNVCPICGCEDEWIDGNGGTSDIEIIYMDWECGNCGSTFKGEYHQIDLSLKVENRNHENEE
jgi:hypothetical protein